MLTPSMIRARLKVLENLRENLENQIGLTALGTKQFKKLTKMIDENAELIVLNRLILAKQEGRLVEYDHITQ